MESGNIDYKWWIGDERPGSWLVVGGGDPWTLYVEMSSGRVSAEVSGEDWDPENAPIIAPDFESFLRAYGTVILGTPEDADGQVVAAEVEQTLGVRPANRFWQQVMAG